MCVLTQPLCHEQDVTQGQFLNRVKKASLNSNFSFYTGYLTKSKELSQLYNFPIGGGKTYRFMPFFWVLGQSETNSIVQVLSLCY